MPSLASSRRKGSAAFARTGLLSLKQSRTFFGVLPEKISRTAAECALAEKTPCSGPQELKLGGVTPLSDHRFARLLQVDGRFVLVVSRDETALPAKANLRELGPARIELSPRALLKREHLDASGVAIPNRLIGSIERNARSIVFRLATP